MRGAKVSIAFDDKHMELASSDELAPMGYALDLFAGCGGMSLGLEAAGFKVVFANELNKNAAATYKKNFPHVNLSIGNIKNISARRLYKDLGRPAIDVIAAGTPCQGFSSAGRREPEDPRNMLYKEVLRFAKVFKPRMIVLENVVGMLSRRNRWIARSMRKDLKKIGYHPQTKVLVASRFGVPQRRRRVFIIAPSIAIPKRELFPIRGGKRVTVSAAIADLGFLHVGESTTEYRRVPRSAYQQRMRNDVSTLHNHVSPSHSKEIVARFASIQAGQRHPRNRGTRKQTHLKLHPNRLANTLTSIPEDSIHYRLNRGLTVREMARIQSFPDKFEFVGPRTTGGPRRRYECPQYTQVANAVPPLMAGAVFAELVRVISNNYGTNNSEASSPLGRGNHSWRSKLLLSDSAR